MGEQIQEEYAGKLMLCQINTDENQVCVYIYTHIHMLVSDEHLAELCVKTHEQWRESGLCLFTERGVVFLYARASMQKICSHGIDHACIYVDIRKDKDVCGGSEDVCGDSEHVSPGSIQDTATDPQTLTASYMTLSF